MQQAETTFADLPPEAAEWKRGLLTLRADRSPCTYLGATAWTDIYEAALDFVDRFGAEAAAHGWTATQLFGVHPQHGTLRTDYCGVMMTSGRKAGGIDARCVTLGISAGIGTSLGSRSACRSGSSRRNQERDERGLPPVSTVVLRSAPHHHKRSVRQRTLQRLHLRPWRA